MTRSIRRTSASGVGKRGWGFQAGAFTRQAAAATRAYGRTHPAGAAAARRGSETRWCEGAKAGKRRSSRARATGRGCIGWSSARWRSFLPPARSTSAGNVSGLKVVRHRDDRQKDGRQHGQRNQLDAHGRQQRGLTAGALLAAASKPFSQNPQRTTTTSPHAKLDSISTGLSKLYRADISRDINVL